MDDEPGGDAGSALFGPDGRAGPAGILLDDHVAAGTAEPAQGTRGKASSSQPSGEHLAAVSEAARTDDLCDLTGVLVTYRNYGGAVLPRGGGGTASGNSFGFTLTIRSGSLDVTVNATGVPGNL